MPKFAYDALKVAITSETLILDKKDNLKMPIKIMAVEAEREEEELEEEEIDEEEAALNYLNAIRIQKGKTPFKKFPRSNWNGNGNGGARPKTTATARSLDTCRRNAKFGWGSAPLWHKGHSKTNATVKLATLTCTTVPVQMNTECGLVPSSGTAYIANIGLVDNPNVTGGPYLIQPDKHRIAN